MTTGLERRCEQLIDTTWYYSRYWRRHEHGSLTLDGWRDVRRDCARRISDLQQRVDDLRRLLPQVEAMIEQRECDDSKADEADRLRKGIGDGDHP